MQRRLPGRGRGFTLLEVLVAATVVVIALLGVASTAANILQRSQNPSAIEAATLFANERLNYFRSQTDPFRAVGGTHYAPPPRPNAPERNNDPNLNNSFNTAPVLLVREYLYAEDENRYQNQLTNVDEGKRNKNREGYTTYAGTPVGRNEIPPMPPTYHRVQPNENGPTDAPAARADGLVFLEAPRANDLIGTGAGQTAALDASVAFVREVWVQTNHPLMTAGSPAPGLGILPAAHANLPPYTVAVTVRVFQRDPRTNRLNLGVDRRQNDGSGPGYVLNRPTAEMVGYFGLRRALR
ncbi:MAG: prepilin-type N-terminal cleavage/methylation domain-containing protein [Candidatus Sericytochromatia bacterium]